MAGWLMVRTEGGNAVVSAKGAKGRDEPDEMVRIVLIPELVRAYYYLGTSGSCRAWVLAAVLGAMRVGQHNNNSTVCLEN